MLLLILLGGCQTTGEGVTSVKPIKVEEPKKEPKKELPVTTVFQTAKPVLCVPPLVLKKGLENNKNENPFATWVYIDKGFRTILLVDKKKKTVTLLEYIGQGYACFLSVGKDIYINETLPVPTGSNVSFRLEN